MTIIAKLCQHLPVIHENVWFPESAGRNPDVFDIIILRNIPPHIGIRPFLEKYFKNV